ncbi:MAG: MopE-related protein [Flavobacteriales bacterium]
MIPFVSRFLLTPLVIVLFCLTGHSQTIEPASNRTWEEMMGDPNTSFFETQQKFNEYWAGRTIEKGKGFKAFKRWENYMQPRVNQTTGAWPDPDAVWQAQQDQPEMFQMNENMPGDWSYIGNTSVPNGGGAGRINGVRALPGSTTTWFACAPGGGLWKTTNSGTSWSSVGTDFLSSIGTSDVAIDPSNTNIMYLATGDGDAYDTYSLGVLKTTDGGTTWNTTGLNWTVTQNRVTNRILIHPTNTQIVIAATDNGIWRTTDGGTNWTQEQAGNFKDLMFKPGDPSIIYAATNQFYKSTDTGNNWTNITTGLPSSANTQRMALAVTDANSAYVYILASGNDSGTLGVYRSTDSGGNFAQQADNAPNLGGWSTDGSDGGGQGWYDLRIVADPSNAETIWTGGVNVWKSTDGGSNFALNGHWYGGGGVPYVHADIHALYFVPGSNRLLCGNDGGVFSTTNGGTNWSDLSSNLPIAQQYRLGLAALNSNLVITGWQDNGTNLKNGAVHSEILGGDGMECAIDPTNSSIMYGEIYYGNIYKSTNGGASFSTIVGSGGANEDEDGAWVTPFVLGTNPSHIFVGKSRVFKSTDGGSSFTASAAFGSGDCNDLAIYPGDNNIIYASKGGSLFKSTDGSNFTQLSGFPAYYITDIATHNSDPNKVWITFSNFTPGEKVFYSSDGGSTWTNISGTLPNIPANAIIYSQGSNDGIYVGMDAGVYYRDNDLGTWVPYMNALPNVEISELEIHYASSTITASTYGRGIWRAPMYAIPNLDASISVSSPTGSYCTPTVTPQIMILNAGETTITAAEIEYQVVGQALQTYSWTGSLATGASETITLPNLNYGTGVFTFIASFTSVNGGSDDSAGNDATSSSYQVITAPANDVCANATSLIVNAAATNVDNSNTCTDGPDPSCGGSGIKDIWHKFDYTGGNITVLASTGSNNDTRLAVFASCGGAQIGCNDDIGGGNYGSQVNLSCPTLSVGQTYYIQSGGYNTGTGTYTIQVTKTDVNGCTNPLAFNYNACANVDDGSCILSCIAPANDVCSTATPITVFGSAVSVSNVVTCTEGPNPNCGGTQIKDVWYSFTYSGGTVSITTSGGTLTDTRLAVYSSCGGSQIACDDDDGTGAYSLINFGCTTSNGVAGANEATLLVSGQTYYIQAGGFNGLTGTFNLTVTVTNVNGCTNPAACNYNPCANVNSGCVLPVTYYQDIDGDLYGNSSVSITQCTPPVGYVTVGGDCNDNNANISPGDAENLCNGIDDNCNGTTDEGRINGCTNPAACNYNAAATCDNGTCTFAITWYLNADGDNYYANTQSACTSPGAGWTSTLPSGGAGDCNDGNTAINPGATENLCNGVDDNCNGTTDEGRINGCTNPAACNYNAAATCDNGTCTFATTWYLNADGDNYYANTQSACASPGVGWTNTAPSGGSGDCNDGNSAINPGATENLCNGVDDNCNGTTDEGRINGCTNPAACNYNAAATCDNGTCTFAITYYLNADGDNYYANTQSACTSPGTGWTSTLPSGGSGDCNDNNSAIHPGVTEVCNGIDDDCDSSIDEGFDIDNDTYTICEGDCNDNDANIFPGAPEACNNIDDDCDSFIDDNVTTQNYYNDLDSDGFGAGLIGNFCSPPGNSSLNNLDCDDNNSAINPNAVEICNGIDDDCDTFIDDNVTALNYYNDTDGDGYGAGLMGNFCIAPANSSLTNDDCDDNNGAIHPGATEICNGIDDDCDSFIDDNVISLMYYNDLDGDGYGAGPIGSFCSPPANSSLSNNDCDDNNASVHPGATETCNNIDDDCDGSTDEGVTTMYYQDGDIDGYGNAAIFIQSCLPQPGYVTNANDCNDNNSAVHPGAQEVCGNSIDENCNGQINEGCGGGGGNNDDMVGATVVNYSGNAYPSCGPFNGTLAGATVSSEGNPANVVTGEDIWFTFTAASTAVRISLSTSSFDGVLELHNAGGTEIDVENMTGFGGTERMNFNGLTEGNQYFVAIRNYDSALGTGAFSLCVQHLMDSNCDYGPGTYAMCTNFKADYSGANLYIFHFTPIGGGATTTASGTSQVSLGLISLGLQYGATYVNTIDALYNLTDGAGNPETILVMGNENCVITIDTQPNVEVKLAQRCPATILRSTTLQGKPYVCGAIKFRFEFTEVDEFGSPIGVPFSRLTTGASSTMKLNFTTPQQLLVGSYYHVRMKPILSYGEGTYGPAQCIKIGGSSQIEIDPMIEPNLESNETDLAIYPNPTNGQQVHLNMTDVDAEFAEIRILDSMGRLIYSGMEVLSGSLNATITFDRPLSNGLYAIEVKVGSKVLVERLQVQK